VRCGFAAADSRLKHVGWGLQVSGFGVAGSGFGWWDRDMQALEPVVVRVEQEGFTEARTRLGIATRLEGIHACNHLVLHRLGLFEKHLVHVLALWVRSVS
jgi:hypothetical protein